jgi:hypothetical protein
LAKREFGVYTSQTAKTFSGFTVIFFVDRIEGEGCFGLPVLVPRVCKKGLRATRQNTSGKSRRCERDYIKLYF